MSNIWFTGDTHFCHNKDFLYTPRGVETVDNMNDLVVENWNRVVRPEDTVYHLGDIALNDTTAAIKYINALNGSIIWFLGNHDSPKRVEEVLRNCPNVKLHSDRYATNIEIKNLHFYLSHYPTLTANFDDKHFSRHVINLHGHTHQKTNWKDPTNPFMYHVGLDSHNVTPVSLDEAVSDIKQRWYEVEKLPPALKPEDIYPFTFNDKKALKIMFEGDSNEN